MERRGSDSGFCRAYLRTMDPERAAAETGRKDGFALLGSESIQTRLERMRAEVDEEYAFEKLRQKASAVTGMEVHYLYEQTALLEEMQKARQGTCVSS